MLEVHGADVAGSHRTRRCEYSATHRYTEEHRSQSMHGQPHPSRSSLHGHIRRLYLSRMVHARVTPGRRLLEPPAGPAARPCSTRRRLTGLATRAGNRAVATTACASERRASYRVFPYAGRIERVLRWAPFEALGWPGKSGAPPGVLVCTPLLADPSSFCSRASALRVARIAAVRRCRAPSFPTLRRGAPNPTLKRRSAQ